MNRKTEALLKDFSVSPDSGSVVFGKYARFGFVLDMFCSGAGPVGDSGYLILWDKSVLESCNDAYMVSDFVDDVFLIGSDGGDSAFGVTPDRKFVSVPFLGMGNDTVTVLSDSFDGFIERISDCDY